MFSAIQVQYIDRSQCEQLNSEQTEWHYLPGFYWGYCGSNESFPRRYFGTFKTEIDAYSDAVAYLVSTKTTGDYSKLR